MKRVLIESPYAGEVERNQMYARFCSHYSVTSYNESPYASHLYFTQEFILDDLIPEERKLGINQISFAAWRDPHLQETAGLTDLGVLVRDFSLGICRSAFTWRYRPESIGITNGPARKLFEAARVDCVVLPVPVATDQIEVFVEEAVFG